MTSNNLRNNEARKLFLDKFPIDCVVDIDKQRLFYLFDQSSTYPAELSFIQYPEEAQISCAMAHEGLDEKLGPRLNLMSDLYKTIRGTIKLRGFERNMYTPRVLPPRFSLEVSEQIAFLGESYEKNPERFREAYTNLFESLSFQLGVERMVLGEDYLHGEKAILGPFDEFKIEVPKPTGCFPNLNICASENADYSRIPELHKILRETGMKTLIPLAKFYNNEPATVCSFSIKLDCADRSLPFSASHQKLLE
jgi:hypothetical protein